MIKKDISELIEGTLLKITYNRGSWNLYCLSSMERIQILKKDDIVLLLKDPVLDKVYNNLACVTIMTSEGNIGYSYRPAADLLKDAIAL